MHKLGQMEPDSCVPLLLLTKVRLPRRFLLCLVYPLQMVPLVRKVDLRRIHEGLFNSSPACFRAGDIFPEHHQDFSSDDSELLLAQDRA